MRSLRALQLTPSMSPSKIDHDYLAEVDDYFSRPYVPLSNLPTPPLASALYDHSKVSDMVHLDPALLGPAIHLTNMIPSSVSLHGPSVPVVHGILSRASVSLKTVALAVCILDSLTSRFSHSWRSSCRSMSPEHASSSLTSAPHTTAVEPEVLALASVLLAAKFIDDRAISTAHYACTVGDGEWTTKQINAAESCILENLQYRIDPLWQEHLINDALLDMERAAAADANLDVSDYLPAHDFDHTLPSPCSVVGDALANCLGTTPPTPTDLPQQLVESIYPHAMLPGKTAAVLCLEGDDDELMGMLLPQHAF